MSDLDPTRRGSGDEPGRPDERVTAQRIRALRSSFIGMALLTAVGFVVLASLTFVPWWAVAPLAVLWLMMMRVGGVWFTAHPRKVLLLPAWLMLAWLAVVVALGLFTDQLRPEPSVDPFPDPPTPPPSSSTPSPTG